jgi:hypothetical protein
MEVGPLRNRAGVIDHGKIIAMDSPGTGSVRGS